MLLWPPETPNEGDVDEQSLRVITFYLPQFYPTPQNNEWWGRGFTEWTNVTKAVPQFQGHYQPHLPADLGFYDLRLPSVRHEQAAMAREYGIHGFCYYHYWFHGERMLERVFEEVFESGEPDFPFCLCWANETWTRKWGIMNGEKDILMLQRYSDEDNLEHIRHLIPIFRDPRYIRINGRPIFLIYRTRSDDFKDGQMERLLEVWDRELEKEGLELYLCSVRTPPPSGFSASVDFFPGPWLPSQPENPRWRNSFKYRLPSVYEKFFFDPKHEVFDYQEVVELMISKEYPDYRMFYCPVPGWDNTARWPEAGALIVKDSSPQYFEKWMSHAVVETKRRFKGDERVIFVNAWNEWAEGCHLEPDLRWGYEYLAALRRALESN